MVLYGTFPWPQFGSGGINTPRSNAYGWPLAEVQAFQLAGSTTGTAGVGTWTTGLGMFRDATVFVDVTGTAGTGALGIFYVDTRLDGTGTTNLAATAPLGSGTQYALQLSKHWTGTIGQDVGADVATGTIRQLGWADDLRIRLALSGTTPLLTYRVWISATQ